MPLWVNSWLEGWLEVERSLVLVCGLPLKDRLCVCVCVCMSLEIR